MHLLKKYCTNYIIIKLDKNIVSIKPFIQIYIYYFFIIKNIYMEIINISRIKNFGNIYIYIYI